MDEQRQIDRDGVMGYDNGMRSHRSDWGVLAALIAVLLVPMTAVPAAAATPAQPASLSIDAEVATAPATTQVDAPDAALRTSGTLAIIVAIAAAGVWLWWYLLVRRGRN